MPKESWEWHSSFSDIGASGGGQRVLLSTLSSPATSCRTIQPSSSKLVRGDSVPKQASNDAATAAAGGVQGCLSSRAQAEGLLKWSATGSLPIIGPSSAENRRKRSQVRSKSNFPLSRRG